MMYHAMLFLLEHIVTVADLMIEQNVKYVKEALAMLTQVYKDFGDTTAALEGRLLHGVFTRDYRYNVENCRILITVPACLEIMLL